MSTANSRPTLADVARAAGVSTALVSIVIRGVPGASPENRRRVLAAAAELGYRPDVRAQLLRRQHSRLLGVVFGVEHPFHGDLVDSIYRSAEEAGYDVALSAFTHSRTEQRAIETLLADRCEALILLGTRLPIGALLHLRRQLPVVVVARRLRTRDVDSVHTDDVSGAALAVQHLVDLGHQSIALIDGGRAAGAADRRGGYRASMAANGLAGSIHIVRGGVSEADGIAATDRLLDSRRPTAIVAFNDRCAIGVLERLRLARVEVPREMSVVGYDDSRMAGLSLVNLTTVGQNADALGKLCVRRAVARLDSSFQAGSDTAVAPYLVVRQTTTAPTTRRGRER